MHLNTNLAITWRFTTNLKVNLINKINLGRVNPDITQKWKKLKPHVFCVWRSPKQVSQDVKRRPSLDEEVSATRIIAIRIHAHERWYVDALGCLVVC